MSGETPDAHLTRIIEDPFESVTAQALAAELLATRRAFAATRRFEVGQVEEARAEALRARAWQHRECGKQYAGLLRELVFDAKRSGGLYRAEGAQAARDRIVALLEDGALGYHAHRGP